MAYKEKSKAIKYNNEFNRNAYDRINLTVPKGQKDVIQAHAAQMGESVNAFIGRAIKNQIAQDSVEAPVMTRTEEEGIGTQETAQKPAEGATEGLQATENNPGEFTLSDHRSAP
jgi:uncharacterized protein (DUF1778 family)